jgi:hypothetical protein
MFVRSEGEELPSEWFRGQNLGDFELQFCESAAEIRANPNAIATLGMIAGTS